MRLLRDRLAHAAPSLACRTARAARTAASCLRYSAGAWTSEGGSSSAPSDRPGAPLPSSADGASMRPPAWPRRSRARRARRRSTRSGRVRRCRFRRLPIVTEAKPSPPCRRGTRDPGQQLARRRPPSGRRRGRTPRPEPADARRARDRHRRADRDEHRRQMVRRVVGADVPADGAAIAHLDVARSERRRRPRIGRSRCTSSLGSELRVGRHRANSTEPVVGLADRRGAPGRRCRSTSTLRAPRSGLHHVDQRLPARERPRVPDSPRARRAPRRGSEDGRTRRWPGASLSYMRSAFAGATGTGAHDLQSRHSGGWRRSRRRGPMDPGPTPLRQSAPPQLDLLSAIADPAGADRPRGQVSRAGRGALASRSFAKGPMGGLHRVGSRRGRLWRLLAARHFATTSWPLSSGNPGVLVAAGAAPPRRAGPEGVRVGTAVHAGRAAASRSRSRPATAVRR